METNTGKRFKIKKVCLKNEYTIYGRCFINSFEGYLWRCAVEEQIPCKFSEDFKYVEIPSGLELESLSLPVVKKAFHKIKLSKETSSAIKEYILGL